MIIHEVRIVVEAPDTWDGKDVLGLITEELRNIYEYGMKIHIAEIKPYGDGKPSQ